jgi:hypothetical protein
MSEIVKENKSENSSWNFELDQTNFYSFILISQFIIDSFQE